VGTNQVHLEAPFLVPAVFAKRASEWRNQTAFVVHMPLKGGMVHKTPAAIRTQIGPIGTHDISCTSDPIKEEINISRILNPNTRILPSN